MNETNVKLVKRQSYSLETKLRLIQEHRNGEETLDSLAEKHFIEKKTFKRWIKDEKTLKRKLKNLPPNLAKWKRLRLTKYMRIDNALIPWFLEQQSKNVRVTGTNIQNKALELAEEFGIENFAASNGWLSGFRARHCIKYTKNYEELEAAKVALNSSNPLESEKKVEVSGFNHDNPELIETFEPLMFHNVNDLIKKEICSDSDNDTIEPEKKVEVNVQLVKRHSYSLGEKLEMIKELRVGKESYESLEEKYQLHRSLLQLWIKKENVYKAKLEKEPNLANMKKLRASKFSRIEDALVPWFHEQQSIQARVSGANIKEKALKLAEELNVQDFSASNGWLSGFLARNNNKHIKNYDKTKSVTLDHTSNIRTDSTEHSVDVQNETDNSTSIDPLKASKEFEFRRANEGQLEREEEDEEEKKRCLDDLEAALMRGETSVKAFCLFYQLKTEIMNA